MGCQVTLYVLQRRLQTSEQGFSAAEQSANWPQIKKQVSVPWPVFFDFPKAIDPAKLMFLLQYTQGTQLLSSQRTCWIMVIQQKEIHLFSYLLIIYKALGYTNALNWLWIGAVFLDLFTHNPGLGKTHYLSWRQLSHQWGSCRNFWWTNLFIFICQRCLSCIPETNLQVQNKTASPLKRGEKISYWQLAKEDYRVSHSESIIQSWAQKSWLLPVSDFKLQFFCHFYHI